MNGYFLRQRHRLSSRRWYWQLRATLKRFDDVLSKVLFGVRVGAIEAAASTSQLGKLFRLVLSVIFQAALLAALLIGTGVLLSRIAPVLGASALVRTLVAPVRPVSDSGLYDGALIAILTVLGLFLTLYFTNLGVLAQTIFGKLPASLRDRLIRDRVANAYIRFIVVLTLIVLLLLLSGVIAGFRYPVSLLLAGALSLVAVPSFGLLSERSYQFLDPTELRHTLFLELTQLARHASSSGRRWQRVPLQRFQNWQARDTVQAFVALTSIANANDFLRTDSLARLHGSAADWMHQYLSIKRRIPSHSLWFSRTARYKEWYLASPVEFTVESVTGAMPPPELKPDAYWIETALLQAVLGSTAECLKDGRISVAVEIVNSMSIVFWAFGSEWHLPYAGSYFHPIGRILAGYVTMQPLDVEVVKSKADTAPDSLRLIDAAGVLPTQLFMAFSDSLEKLDPALIAERAKGIEFIESRRVDSLDLPACCLESLEAVQKLLQFERLAGERIVTPPWYVAQLLAAALAGAVRRGVDTLVDQAMPFYRLALTWAAEQHHLEAVTLLWQGFQFADKVLAHLPRLRRYGEKLDALRLQEQPGWPVWAWDDIEKRTRELLAELEVCRSELVVPLLEYAAIPGIPDSFGWALRSSGKSAFAALKANEADRFRRIFRGYFYGVLVGSQLGRTDMSLWSPEIRANVTIQPLLELYELSGLAIYWAEYHANLVLWKICQALWDSFLGDEHRAARLELVAICTHIGRSPMTFAARGPLVEAWAGEVTESLKSLPRHRPRPQLREFDSEDSLLEVNHPNMLLQAIGSRYGRATYHHLGLDLFVELYIRSFPDAQKLDFGRARDLEHRLSPDEYEYLRERLFATARPETGAEG